MNFKVELQEIKSISPEDLTLHPEALATPKMSSTAYEALKRDIEANGQLDPVLTYRNRIVDGRHRWLILQELGIDFIKYIELPNNSTIAQLRRLVQSKETRRHETAGQLAIRAYRLYTQKDSEFTSMSASADAVGANRKRVSEVKKVIELYGRLDLINKLFDGEQVNVGTLTIPFWTDSLGTILRWLEEHGTIINVKEQLSLIEPRKELTKEEEVLVNSYVIAIGKESELVRRNTVNRLYTLLKEAQ